MRLAVAEIDNRSVFKEALGLAELEFDWSSYGSAPIDRRAITAACEFAIEHVAQESRRTALVVPAVDGGVQLEWHQDGADLEIAWRADGSFSSVFRKDEIGRLAELEYDIHETTGEVVASWAICAASEWPPKGA